MIQENHTTDAYFRDLAPWGANVATGWPTSANPPPQPPFSPYYPPHDRRAYFNWLTKGTAEHSQYDTVADIPFYLYLAITGAFLENHCAGYGTNSTPNHLLLIGGQSPTLGNPPRRSQPVWDLPSLPGLAEDRKVGWRCYVPPDHFPISFYQQLKASPNVLPSSQFVADARAGGLPALVYLWHQSGQDEHPPANITDGIVATPAVEYTPDNVQLAFGPRVPLLMFGGRVKPGIDSRWCSHVSVPRTAIQLLGLANLGVPRLDGDAGLSDLVDPAMKTNPPPPAFGTLIKFPAAPSPTPAVHPLPPRPPGAPAPVGPVLLRKGETLPPPNDAPLPRQPKPPA